MVELRKFPDPILLAKAKRVSSLEEGKKIADKLLLACEEVEWGTCAGMAAPQIGISKRVFVADGHAYINPKVVWSPSTAFKSYKEGCYSLERQRYDYPVQRPYAVILEWTDYEGAIRQQRFNGSKAQVILHEFDHLEGVLCNHQQA